MVWLYGVVGCYILEWSCLVIIFISVIVDNVDLLLSALLS